MWVSDYLRGEKKYEEAVGFYEGFLEKHSESRLAEAAYFGLGECHYALGRWAEATDNYSKAVQMKGPALLDAKISLGVSYARDRKFDQARPILVEMSKSGVPEHEARALFWLGSMLLDEAKQEKDQEARKEKLNRARLDFIKVEILYSSSDLRPESMFRVAEAFELSGNTEEAMKQYQKVVEEYPDSGFAEQSSKRLELNQSD
jgi:TolA-binding protein